MHNFESCISAGDLFLEFDAVVAPLLKTQLEKNFLACPPGSSGQLEAWVHQCLSVSTKALGKAAAAAEGTNQCMRMLRGVQVGQELTHLHRLVAASDGRGSDVVISTGLLRDAEVQLVPYPAFCWDWHPVQTYRWHNSQHINSLEFLACFNFLRHMVNCLDNHNLRFVHVLDSRVISCVISKGRSSSIVLNRIARRFAALVLTSNVYPKCVWTISAWNFSDSGSRAVARLEPNG